MNHIDKGNLYRAFMKEHDKNNHIYRYIHILSNIYSVVYKRFLKLYFYHNFFIYLRTLWNLIKVCISLHYS